jgi:hypothetical protein
MQQQQSKYLISNRGNLTNPNKETENSPEAILNAINAGFHCKIDIRRIEGVLYLGQYVPKYIVELDFLLLYADKLWIQCKNTSALHYLKSFDELCVFYCEKDAYTLTSDTHVWMNSLYSGKNSKKQMKNTIVYLPEQNEFKIHPKCKGICSDYIEYFRDFLQNNPC